MTIAFLNYTPWDYNIETPYQMPMGGSQSALCYLAEALAREGRDIFMLNYTSVPGISRRVMCLPLDRVSRPFLKSLDALIILNMAGRGRQVKPLLGTQTRLILWTQHDRDQPAIQALQDPAERDAYDNIVLVSDWQRTRLARHFGIDLGRTQVLRNAIAPCFQELFPDNKPILTQKSHPPVLAYTSTPFRGLDILLEVFPKIRRAVPGTRLKVFSSMKVYQVAETEDTYSSLYQKCQETEGVEYIGSLPQPDLARELQSAMVLAYPNSFPETSCIAVMEAMASGCRIVTSDLGALPETAAGFASLVPVEGDWEAYKERFVETTVRVLRECTAADSNPAETHLRQQVNHINRSCTWSVRAREWAKWLSDICGKPAIASRTEDQQQAYQSFIQEEYEGAAKLYEQAIEASPTATSNYWYLGLTFLLQGQESEARATWMWAIVNGSPDRLDAWGQELVGVLQAEAERRSALGDYRTAQLIQEYIQEIRSDSA